jgi:hypothetical protein
VRCRVMHDAPRSNQQLSRECPALGESRDARPACWRCHPVAAAFDPNRLPAMRTYQRLGPMLTIARACLSIALATGFGIPIQLPTSSPGPGPGPRSGHSLVYDADRKRLVAVDGYLPPHDSSPGELWTWDGRRWELVPGSASGPSKRMVGSATFDVRRSRIISFGGSHSSRGTLGDTWEWNGKTWQEIADTRVDKRDHHVLVYDEARGKTVLFGGNSGPAPWPTDTWAWDGTSWTRAATEGL